MKIAQIALLIGLVFHATPVRATYSLSAQSKDYIQLAALIGASVGGGCGLIAWSSQDDMPHTTFWQKVVQFGKYVLTPATIGAGIGAGIAFLTTHESKLQTMENTLAKTEMQSDFELAMKEGTELNDFKELHFDAKYPLHSSYDRLVSALNTIKSLKKKLPAIVNSGIDTIAPQAKKMLEDIQVYNYEAQLLKWIHTIKNNAAYASETACKTIELVGHNVANAIRYNAWVNANRHCYPHAQPRRIVVYR